MLMLELQGGEHRMDVDQYLRDRTDLISRVLLEPPCSKLLAPEWRFYAAGSTCLTLALAAEIWAALALVDPGYFARVTLFLIFVLIAGTLILAAQRLSDFLLARAIVRSRDAVKQNTLGRMLDIEDGLVAACQRSS